MAAAGLGAAALKVGLDYNRMQQTSRAALLTILGSAEAVNAQMAKLDAFASKSPFAKQVFLQAQQQMLGFGIEASKVIPYLDAIQNSVAAVGGSNSDIAEIVDIFSKIAGASKITSQNLNELGHRGLDAAAIIGKAMGKTAQEIRAEITAGTLDAGAALDALAAGMTAQFGGATDNIKQQMDGAADRVKAAWRDIGSVMATPLIDPTSGGQLVEWTNLFADGLRQIQKQAGPVTDIIWGRLGPGIDFVTETMQKANVAIAGWNSAKLERALDKIAGYAPLVAGTSAALFALGTGNIPVLARLGLTLNPVVAGLAAMTLFSPQLRAVGSALLDALKPAVAPAQDLARVLGDFLMAAIDALAPALAAVATGGGNLAVVFLNLLVPAVKAVAAVALPVVEIASSLVTAFAGLPTPVLAAVAAFAGLKALGLDKVLVGITAAGANMFAPMIESFKASKAVGHALGVELTGMQTAMMTAKAGALALGTALKTALVANAPMLALSALIGVIAHFSKVKQEAQQRVDAFRATLDQETAAVTENSRAWVAKQLQDKGVLEAYTQMGGQSRDLVGAMLGEADARAKVDATMKASLQVYQAHVAAVGGAENAEWDWTEAHTMVSAMLNSMPDELQGAIQKQLELARATEGGTDAATAHSDALKTEAEAADRLRQAEQDLAAAKGNLIAAGYAAADAADHWRDSVEAAGGVQKDMDGNLIRSGDAWRAWREGAVASRDTILQYAEGMAKAGASQAEIDTYLAEAVPGWYANGDAIAGATGEAERFAEEIGGFPPVVALQVEANTLEAYEDIEALLVTIQEGVGVLTIDANDDPALQKLMKSLGFVDNGTGVYTIDANDDPATAELLLSLLDVNTSTGVMGIDAENEEAMRRLDQTANEINKTWEDVKIGGEDRTEPVRSAIKKRIDQTYADMKVRAQDQTGPTISDIIRSINSRVATIQVRAAGGGSGMVGFVGADGGIVQGGLVQRFAQGGFSNLPSQATLMPGRGKGLIQWAEAETSVEAFIPYAPGKRRRSLEILARVADDFGYTLARPQSFRDGGLTGVAPVSGPAGAGGITVQQLVVDVAKVRTLSELETWLRGLGIDLAMAGISH